VGWELIGGDPAPGSTDAVTSAASAFQGVAALARETRADLVQGLGQLGVSRWKGTAAAAFRADVGELPTRLGEIDESYETAGRALNAFRIQLEKSQGEARAALVAAEQADRDRRATQQRADAARMDADSLRVQRRSANARVLTLQAQLATTLDPAQRASLDTALAAARARANRLNAEVKAADQNVARHTAAVREAEERLERAQADATAIRDRMKVYVQGAVTALKQAEKYGNLPSFTERFAADTKQGIATYGPVVADSMQKGSEWFSIAGTVFPPGAVIFKSFSVILGGAGLIVSAASYAAEPGGLTPDKWLKLSDKALGVGLTMVGMGAASKLSTAGKFAKAGTVLGYAKDVTGVAVQTREHGLEGLVIGVGGVVLGRAGEKVAGDGLRVATSTANKNRAVAGMLDAITKDIGRSKSTVLGVPLVSDMQSRAGQSLVSAGRRDGGEFLFGNRARTEPSIADHLMGSKEVSGLQNDVTSALPKEGLEWIETKLLGDPEPEPEIDIDLHPSSYGGTR
jgi:hypothetical protein